MDRIIDRLRDAEEEPEQSLRLEVTLYTNGRLSIWSHDPDGGCRNSSMTCNSAAQAVAAVAAVVAHATTFDPVVVREAGPIREPIAAA